MSRTGERPLQGAYEHASLTSHKNFKRTDELDCLVIIYEYHFND